MFAPAAVETASPRLRTSLTIETRDIISKEVEIGRLAIPREMFSLPRYVQVDNKHGESSLAKKYSGYGDRLE
jgi:hypothetical protein